jgi:hypothetical protein
MAARKQRARRYRNMATGGFDAAYKVAKKRIPGIWPGIPNSFALVAGVT